MDHDAHEGFHVGNDADGLKGAAVVELDDRRGVDVDADDVDPGGQEIADRDRVERGCDHEAEGDALDFFAHHTLRLDGVGDDVGERAVVADAAAEDVVDAVLHAVVHDARFEDAFFDGWADAAGAADAVDRAEVMLVARFDNVAFFELHAEAGGKERLFDVVRRKRVAREQDFEIAFADEFAEVLAAAAVDDCGAADE